MKFAIVDGQKLEPFPKGKGICPSCGNEMVAKCGRFKVWHWAHKSTRHCDSWWENETEWHRKWKSYFPLENQEVSHTDVNSGELHIADIKTNNDIVIECQNSPIKLEEVESREEFYDNMIWIVNGNREKTRQHGQFLAALQIYLEVVKENPLTIEFCWTYRNKLFEKWANSQVPVYFDFGSNFSTEPVNPYFCDYLLLFEVYDEAEKKVTARVIKKKDLIEGHGGEYEELFSGEPFGLPGLVEV